MSKVPHVSVDAIPQVVLAFMNEDHATEAELLNAAIDATAAHRDGKSKVEDVLQAYDALLAHTQEHFGREEEAMRQVAFPPFPMHKGEHDRVIDEMEAEEVHFRETGDTGRLFQYLTDAVPAWFVGHIQSMDAVTAQFVTMRRGG